MSAPRDSDPLLTAWRRTVRTHGPRTAITLAATGEQTTFAQLDAAAAATAARLATDLGALGGCRIVFALPNGPEWLATFLALRRLGAIAVPVEPGGPPEHAAATAEALRAAGWLDAAGSHRRLGSIVRTRRPLCLLKLTSGSTGRPRPLPFTGAEMLADGRQIARTMGIGPADVNHATIPFGHSYGLGNLVMPLLAQGTALVCGSSPLPHAVGDEVARWRPTVWPTVPAILRALAQSGVARPSLASLRTVISAGAVLPPEVAQAFAERFGRRVHNFYGSSETGGIAYDRDGRATISGTAVGTALAGVELRLARGGRVEVRSAAAYSHGNRRGAGRVLLPDRGELTPGGELRLLGRTGRFAKIGGRRVGFAEVEAALRALPGVLQAHVTALSGREPLLAAVVVSEHSPDALRAALRGRAPDWRIPKLLLRLPEFPLTARGKVDTAALTALLADRLRQSRT